MVIPSVKALSRFVADDKNYFSEKIRLGISYESSDIKGQVQFSLKKI